MCKESEGERKIHRRYYELCALHQFQRGSKCKEVWVDGAFAYRNPSEDLPQDWDEIARRAAHYQKLGEPSEPRDFIERLRHRLTQALAHFNRQLPTLSHVRIRDPKPDRPEAGVLVIDKLPRQSEPTSLGVIKDAIQRQYGMLELLEVFAEADRITNFTRFFEHSGTKQVRSRRQLQPLVLFALFAEGTSLGLKRVVNASQRMMYEELLYVRKTYLSVEALRNGDQQDLGMPRHATLG